MAQEIFGKNRRQSAPSNNKKPQTPLGGSLASRVGIAKERPIHHHTKIKTNDDQRSSSAASIPTLGNKQQNRGGQKNRNGRQAGAGADTRANTAFENATQQVAPRSFNSKQFANNDTELSIRGAAGPYCVVASNFAPGTTAADIGAVMTPIGGEMSACKLISSYPTVICELLFLDKTGADNVVSLFNGKKVCSGRTWHLG